MLPRLAFLLFALIAPFISCEPIDDLQGEWVLVICNDEVNCNFYFNFTMTITIDQSQLITNDIRLLNGKINSYQTLQEQYTYESNSDGSYTLTPTKGGLPYTLLMYDNKSIIAYSVQPTHKNQGIYHIYGLQRPDAIDATSILFKCMDNFPKFPQMFAGFTYHPIPFQTALNLNLSILTSKVWFITASWTDDWSKAKAPVDGTCIESIFATNWTNGIGGLVSEYNYAVLQTEWSKEAIATKYIPINFPDPVLNSWFHQDGTSMGVLYADQNTLITLTGDKSEANLMTTSPIFSSISYALFNAQIVKAGVNPAKGASQTFSNTECDPSTFKLTDLVGAGGNSWGVSATASNHEDSDKFHSLACLNLTFEFDAENKNQINMAMTGIDLQNDTNFELNMTFTYKEGQDRYLYPIDSPESPFYITEINPDLLMLDRTVGDRHEAYVLVRKMAELSSYVNQFLLDIFFPGEAILLPYSDDQCDPPTPPAANITQEIISDKWYNLAAYFGFEGTMTNVSCWQWSITNNTKYPAYLDIIAKANMDYSNMEFASVNSPVPNYNGYLIPQVSHVHQDSFNNNKTELWLTVQHFDGQNLILVNFDVVNAGTWEFYFLSKGLEYTPQDEQLFKDVVRKISEQFEDQYYYIIDNEGCGF